MFNVEYHSSERSVNCGLVNLSFAVRGRRFEQGRPFPQTHGFTARTHQTGCLLKPTPGTRLLPLHRGPSSSLCRRSPSIKSTGPFTILFCGYRVVPWPLPRYAASWHGVRKSHGSPNECSYYVAPSGGRKHNCPTSNRLRLEPGPGTQAQTSLGRCSRFVASRSHRPERLVRVHSGRRPIGFLPLLGARTVGRPHARFPRR